MAATITKSVRRPVRKSESATEETSLAQFNRLIARAAPRAKRETAAALQRLHRDIAATIRRAG